MGLDSREKHGESMVFVATGNDGKMRELRATLAEARLRLERLSEYLAPDESGTTYRENALLKARALRAQLGRERRWAAVLADDSGIEVRGLGGRPGVRSARYGGEIPWTGRRELLLRELGASGSSDRSARFVCALAFIDADGTEFIAEGTCVGRIPTEERGEGGFSYDAIFELAPSWGGRSPRSTRVIRIA